MTSRVLALTVVVLAFGCSLPEQPDGGADGGNEAPLDGVVLEYRWGNQITGSDLELIGSAGAFTFQHQDRTCCPPTFADAGVPTLTAAQTSDLSLWLRACEGKAVTTETSNTGALGSTSGSVVLFPDAGARRTVLFEVERTSGTDLLIRRNTCAYRGDLLRFVNDIVNNDAPVD